MKRIVTLLAITAFCASAAQGASAGKGNLGNPGVAPLLSMPYGKSYGQWSMEWWLYSMPKTLEVLPFAFGTDGTVGQSRPVWFLGGTFTGPWDGSITREITVPAGTALFFPVFNVECSTLEPPESAFHGDDEASLRACANAWGDQIVGEEWGPVFCRVDGVELQNVTQYRCETPLIETIIPAMDSNIFLLPTTGPTPVQSVGDGVYIFLYPLPVGTHTLEIPNVTYTITVAPR